MVKFRGFEVKIKANGEFLKEFNDDNHDDRDMLINNAGKTISIYVEAVSGSNFEIHCKSYQNLPVLPRAEGIIYYTWLDGKKAGGNIVRGGLQPYTHRGIEFRDNAGGYRRRDFAFADLDIGESGSASGEDFGSMRKLATQLGSIKVSVMRYSSSQRSGVASPGHGLVDMENLADLQKVPEEALKGDAKTQRSVLAPAKQGRVFSFGITQDIDTIDDPYVTFVFKYRSRASLEALLIVPRPPSLEERPRDELSREELLELLGRREAERSNSAALLKSEDGPGRIIKSEYEAPIKRGQDAEYDAIVASARVVKKQRTNEPIVLD